MGVAKLIEVEKMEMEVFTGVDENAFPFGDAFLALSRHLPLAEISDSKHHQLATEVLTRASLYLSSHEGRLPKSVVVDFAAYLGSLGRLIQAYESRKFPSVGKVSGEGMLAYFMELHDLKQGDLAKELGGQSVVSELIRGERKLNVKQIRALAARFNVSPATFIGTV